MIINIPRQTKVNRIIPKDRFSFENPKDIERIRWEAKLSVSTLNIPNKKINEIEIISIKASKFNTNIVKNISDKIPQKIVFIVNETTVIMSYESELIIKNIDFPLIISGLTIDEVYDNFIRQLLGIKDSNKNLSQQVLKIRQIKLLEEGIDKINQQIIKTPQLNKKQLLSHNRYDLEQKLKDVKE